MSENNLKDLPEGLKKDTTSGEGKTIFKISDKVKNEMSNKSEDDSNSYNLINNKIINKMKDKKKDLVPASDKDVKILKSKMKTKRGRE